jgi:predicted metal-dependent hydrolase
VKLRRDRSVAVPLPLPGFEPDVLDAPPDHVPPPPPVVAEPPRPSARTFAVRVIRSPRRTRTSAARMVGDTLEIRLPAWMSAAEEAHWVEEWSRRFRRRAATDRVDLTARAANLARRCELPTPSRISWVDDMRTRWGSCTVDEGTIRISSALAAYPDWVIDYVIVHELAHLREPGHGPAFWALVERYPRSERARGFLMAKSGEDEEAW